MQGRIRHALKQPALASVFMLAGGLAMSWPLLDVAVGDCAVGPVSATIAFECQWQTMCYLFSLWSTLIVALMAIALASAPGRVASTNPANHA